MDIEFGYGQVDEAIQWMIMDLVGEIIFLGGYANGIFRCSQGS